MKILLFQNMAIWNIILNCLTLNSLTMDFLTINSPKQEPCGEHIPEVSSTSAIPSVISQLQKKNKKIKKLKEIIKSYEQAQKEKYLLIAEFEKYNEQWRNSSLKLLHKNEKLKGKCDKAVVNIKRLHKLVRNWRVEASKHLSHISMLKKKLKEQSNPAGRKLNIVVNVI